jgi:hypothetical protein
MPPGRVGVRGRFPVAVNGVTSLLSEPRTSWRLRGAGLGQGPSPATRKLLRDGPTSVPPLVSGAHHLRNPASGLASPTSRQSWWRVRACPEPATRCTLCSGSRWAEATRRMRRPGIVMAAGAILASSHASAPANRASRGGNGLCEPFPGMRLKGSKPRPSAWQAESRGGHRGENCLQTGCFSVACDT